MLDIFKKKLKKVLKVKSLGQFSLRIKRKVYSKIYRKKYSTTDLLDLMLSMGLKKGSNILIHSSWNEFYNYIDTPSDFIDGILNIIGADGTLIMPAYPFFRKKDQVFDLKRTPTASGLLSETFRTYEGVLRSVNIQHSVCALGPQSKFLLEEHVKSATCWDKYSPYYKLKDINALVFNIGLGKYHIGTVMHCVESILKDEIPYFSQFFGKIWKYQYRDYDSCVYDVEFVTTPDDLDKRFKKSNHIKFQKKYLDQSKFIRKRISNLTVSVCDAKYVIDRTIELGKRGISYFSNPKPPVKL